MTSARTKSGGRGGAAAGAGAVAEDAPYSKGGGQHSAERDESEFVVRSEGREGRRKACHCRGSTDPRSSVETLECS